MFSLDDRVAVVTGGGGVLGSAMARGLSAAGARVVVTGRTEKPLRACVDSLDGPGLAITADVLARNRLDDLRARVLEAYGRVDILVNAAGGNVAEATLQPGADVFALPEAALRQVVDLNLMGTVLPTQVFGADLAKGGGGSIINITSMAADRAITRVLGYSVAKAAVENYTKWMATELARRFGSGLRVNAISPGFFLADQNRALLTKSDGSLTERGQRIVDLTPAGRFGNPEELVGTLVWLCGDGARFVTGAVVPVDGGFSAFSGV